MYRSWKKIRSIKRQKAEKRYRDQIRKNQDCRILVILHLFYPESWTEIREYLQNLECYHWQLVVTFPKEKQKEIEQLDIASFQTNTILMPLENLGYDVAPFLLALSGQDLSQYDIVIKIQSKGTGRHIFIYDQLFWGRDWFVNLFEGILGASSVHKAIDCLMSDPKTAIVAAENLIVHDPSYKAHIVQEELSEKKIRIPDDYRFVAGTCFAASAAYLQQFLQDIEPLYLKQEDFTMMDASRGLSLAHLLERYLCIDAEQHGYRLQGIPVCRARRASRKPMEALCRALSSQRLLKLPYHIDEHYFLWQLDNQFVLYKLRKMPLSGLSYFYPDPPQLLKIDSFFPYRYLMGDKKAYEDYCRFHEKHGLPIMSPERYDALISSMEQNGYDQRNIILITEFDTILDGQHRACWLAYKYGIDYEIEMLEISILTRRRAMEQIIPRPLRIYLEKRYLQKRCVQKTTKE